MVKDITYGEVQPGKYCMFIEGVTRLSKALNIHIKGYRILSRTEKNGLVAVKWSGLMDTVWSLPVYTSAEPEKVFACGVDVSDHYTIECPYEAELKKTYLVWRNSGKNRSLMTVEKLEPGDEKYTF